MKLLGIVIKNYNDEFVNKVFNLSPEFIIDYDFENNKLSIQKNEGYIKGAYGENIYGITPIIGQNGCGKSTLLNLLGNNRQDRAKDNRLGYLNEKKNKKITCKYFILYEAFEGEFYIESFNWMPIRINWNNEDKTLFPTTDRRFDNPTQLKSAFFNDKFQGRMVRLKESSGLEYEEVIYMPTDTDVHDFDDYIIPDSYNKCFAFIRRNYIVKSDFLAEEYLAYIKLAKNNMVTSDLKMKFDLSKQDNSIFILGENLQDNNSKLYGNTDEIQFQSTDINYFLEKVYCSVVASMLGSAVTDNAIVAEIKANYDDFINEIKRNERDRCYSLAEIENKLFSLYNDLSFESIDDNECVYLWKKFIAHLFVIRSLTVPGKNYFMVNIPVNAEFNNNIYGFLKSYDDLTRFYNFYNSYYEKHGDEISFKFHVKDVEDFNKVKISDLKIYEYQPPMKMIIKLDTEFISDGEKRLIHLVGALLNRIDHNIEMQLEGAEEDNFNKVDNYKYVPVIVDEIETNLHLEWSRNFISVFEKIITEFIQEKTQYYKKKTKISKSVKSNTKIQLIFSTHSPFMLSDIVQNNAIVLSKEDNKVVQNKLSTTFATNIQEIMSSPMFVKECYGQHAIDVINDVITDLSEEDNNGELKKSAYFQDKEDELKIIKNIGEVVLRNKLIEMYQKKYKSVAEIKIQDKIDTIIYDKNLTDEEKAIKLKEMWR